MSIILENIKDYQLIIGVIIGAISFIFKTFYNCVVEHDRIDANRRMQYALNVILPIYKEARSSGMINIVKLKNLIDKYYSIVPEYLKYAVENDDSEAIESIIVLDYNNIALKEKGNPLEVFANMLLPILEFISIFLFFIMLFFPVSIFIYYSESHPVASFLAYMLYLVILLITFFLISKKRVKKSQSKLLNSWNKDVIKQYKKDYIELKKNGFKLQYKEMP